MTRKMLIDATHAEETRVVVTEDNRLINFDYESQVRKQLKGSIFLAKVTRVEPSLQAAFVNFGGNRHGFLPFSEIHPDYFRIPISDREAILAEQQADMEARQEADEAEVDETTEEKNDTDTSADEEENDDDIVEEVGGDIAVPSDKKTKAKKASKNAKDSGTNIEKTNDAAEDETESSEDKAETDSDSKSKVKKGSHGRNQGKGRRVASHNRNVEIVGGDGVDSDRPTRPSLRKHYKIQEVIKRGQIMLIQISREERGNKGAAVTTYMSLPGRYCVLMPNSPRSGGVSRKIDNFKDRRRMKEILSELKVPDGMSVIMRTAGVERTKAEIKRDADYLMRMWDDTRKLTLESTVPALIHEEGNLIRRSIRDIYTRDVEEVIVSGEEGHKMAKDFMKTMIPSHAKKVKLYNDEKTPLFHKYQMESQINEIGNTNVTLKSGGYLVINPTEALVSIDVNSGKATRARNIEATAVQTNMEAAEEVARQLRLRDLGGLVVIDFIDMEDRRNNRKVENCIKKALSSDRARIQIGRISSFGLMELSRQRLNPSLTEAQYEVCQHCSGVGYVRTVDSAAIIALRALEEEGSRERTDNVSLTVSNAVAIYILNNKRDMLADIERRYGFKVIISVDDNLVSADYQIDSTKESGSKPASRNSKKREGTEHHKEDGHNSGRGGRRRGRRGGRNQNRDRDNNKASSNKTSDTSENKDSNVAKDKQNKPHKSDATEKNTDRNQETDKKENNSSKHNVKSSSKPKSVKEKPEEKADNKPAIKETNNEPEKKKTTEKTKSAKKPAAKSDKKETSTPSNDVSPVQSKEYEVVNEAPTKKKKGWWSKGGD